MGQGHECKSLLSLCVRVGGWALPGIQKLPDAYTSQTHCHLLHALVTNRVVTKLEGREVGERLLAFEGLTHRAGRRLVHVIAHDIQVDKVREVFQDLA